MSNIQLDRATASHGFLRGVLAFDAATCIATGALLAGASGFVAGLTGLPALLLFYAGLSLLPFAALLIWLASRPVLPRAAVLAVAGYNALWALDSVVLLASGIVRPTALGIAFVLAQAAVVAVLALLQARGSRALA